MERGKQQSSHRDSEKSSLAHTKDFEVKQFLDRYAEALSDANVDSIAEKWSVPAFVVGDDSLMAVTTPGETENFFKLAKENYAARGITKTRPEIQKLDWIAEHIATVRARWLYYDDQENEVGDEVCTYTLRYSDDGEFHILVAIMHGTSVSH